MKIIKDFNQKPIDMEITFKGFKCEIELGQYRDGSIALSLIEVETGDPVATASIFMDKVFLPKHAIVVKDYSENEGILDALTEAGALGESCGDIFLSQWVTAPIMMLSEKLLNQHKIK